MVAMGMQPQDQAQRRDVIPDDVKQMVWMRDGGSCRHCGAQAELQFDHIIPVAMGGSSSAENLQILCGPCNRRKSAGLTIR
jgi:5-methylcytosine-specific restriction endonuclease McrA